MGALSDALPTGHRAMANPTLQLHFGCGRATPRVSHSHNWPFGRMQNFLFKLFFANKDPKTNVDAWMILQKPVLSSKCNDFFKIAYLKAISSSVLSSKCNDFFWNSLFEGDIIFCHLKMVPYNGCSQMLHISFKTEKSFIAHPWCLLSIVGLEEYSAHDRRTATSVQHAPVTWREWGLCSKPLTKIAHHSPPLTWNLFPVLLHRTLTPTLTLNTTTRERKGNGCTKKCK